MCLLGMHLLPKLPGTSLGSLIPKRLLLPNDPLQFDGEERLGLCRDVSCDDEKSVEKLKIITVYITIGLAPEKEKKKKQRKNVSYSAIRDHKLLNTTTVVLKCS